MNIPSSNVHPLRIADARTAVRHVFIRDMELYCLIGVHTHERRKSQRVRINLDLAVSESEAPVRDRLEDVVSYEDVADGIRRLVGGGHVNLVETLAERIADMCLADDRVQAVRVRIEKLDIFPDAVSAGVEIERVRQKA